MSLKTICRLCLAINAPMRSLADSPLRDIYERLTDMSLDTLQRPLVACFLCYSQLKKCHNLMVRSARAEEVLSQMLHCGEVLSEESIAIIKSKACELNNTLSITPIKLIEITDPKHNLTKLTIKEEPIESQDTDLIEIGRDIQDLKTENLEECIDSTGLGKEKDNESSDLIDRRDIKSEDLGAVDIDTEQLTEENVALKGDKDIATAAVEGIECTGVDVDKNSSKDVKEINICNDNIDDKSLLRDYLGRNNGAKTKNNKKKDEITARKCTSNKKVKKNTKVQNRRFQCDVCQKRFNRKEHLAMHLLIHTGEKNFKCAICQKRFRTKKNLNSHLSVHTGEKPYECEACRRLFSKKNNLVKHIEKVHAEVKPKKPFECAICQRRFIYKSVLAIHLKTHNPEETFECEICLKSFTQPANLRNHLKIHTLEKPFECAICEQKFTVKASLAKHIRRHTGEKPYKCAICQKKFGIKGLLDAHLRIHTGEKPFECAVCHKKFTVKSNVYKHLRVHTGEKPFQCTICQRRFTENGSLKRHLKWHTGEKPFQCDICQQRFIVVADLNQHLRRHTWANMFECNICSRTYATDSSLKRHKYTHYKKPFKCAICGKRFNVKCSLNRHLKTHIGDKSF